MALGEVREVGGVGETVNEAEEMASEVGEMASDAGEAASEAGYPPDLSSLRRIWVSGTFSAC